MNEKNKIKDTLLPSSVVRHYIGEPVKENSLGLWYKSPFRDERTASFLVNDAKGIHDFGTSEHYDVIDFVEKLFNIDFVTAINKLFYDFGITTENRESKKLKEYLIKKREEELEIKKKLNEWFNSTYIKICEELMLWKRLIPHLKQEALVIAYKNEMYLEYLTEIFINAKENEKIEIWRAKGIIEKYIK